MKKATLITQLFLSVAVAVSAQDMVPITLEEAMARTLTENPAVKASQYEQLAARHERKAAFGLRLPQVGVAGAYVLMGDDIGLDFNKYKTPLEALVQGIAGSGLPVPPEILQHAGAVLNADWGLTIQDRNFATVAGTVTVPLFMGGKINAANRAAHLNERTAAEKGSQARGELVSELVERYYGLSLAMNAVRVRQQVVEAMHKHLSDAKALEESGMIARSERLLVEVKASEAERDLMAARLQEQTIRTSLCNTLNDPARFVPATPMFILPVMHDAEYYRHAAVTDNPRLRQVSLKRDLALENVKVKRAEFLPQVALVGYGSICNYQVTKYIPRWGLGAGMKINIFDGTRREFQYAAAKNTVRQIEELSQKAQNDISILIDKLYNEMVNYSERFPSIEASLGSAEEYLRVKSAGFREGVATASDVIDAELNLASIKIEKLQTAYYYDLMLARLLEAAGMGERFCEYAAAGIEVTVEF